MRGPGRGRPPRSRREFARVCCAEREESLLAREGGAGLYSSLAIATTSHASALVRPTRADFSAPRRRPKGRLRIRAQRGSVWVPETLPPSPDASISAGRPGRTRALAINAGPSVRAFIHSVVLLVSGWGGAQAAGRGTRGHNRGQGGGLHTHRLQLAGCVAADSRPARGRCGASSASSRKHWLSTPETQVHAQGCLPRRQTAHGCALCPGSGHRRCSVACRNLGHVVISRLQVLRPWWRWALDQQAVQASDGGPPGPVHVIHRVE